jgi:uncharacterized membrane protein
MFDWINIQDWLVALLLGSLITAIIFDIVYYFKIERIKRIVEHALGINFEEDDDK